MPDRNKVNIYDIASAAGVTISTVSRVFNRPEMIGEKTRKRVLEIADKLNYRPNALAGSLTSGRTMLIGLVLSDIRNPSIASMARGIQDIIQHKGFLPIICSTAGHVADEIELIREMSRRGIDGMIMTSSFGTVAPEVLEFLQKEAGGNLPTAYMGPPTGIPNVDSIGINADAGGRDAVEYLVSLGHRRIACLRASRGIAPRRWQAYIDTLEHHGIAFCADLTADEETNFEGGYTAMKSVLNCKERPTAVFAINDLMALGAVHACQDEGLRVPEDISIIGFDDIPSARTSSPSLTTVSQPSYEMGQMAANWLLERIENPDSEERNCEMQCELIIRNSTRAL